MKSEMQELIAAAQQLVDDPQCNCGDDSPDAGLCPYERTRAAIAAARASEGGWIACKERLPENNSDVLCWAGNGTHRALYRTGSIIYRWDCDNYGFEESEITHWQPLPSPPLSVETPK